MTAIMNLLMCKGKGVGARSDMLAWNAATNDVLLEARRGDPPASRALCPSCRWPLKYVAGGWTLGMGECARSGESVTLSQPHFQCENDDCGDVVSLEEGPGAFIDPEYDVYNEQTRSLDVDSMTRGKGGQVHQRTRGLVMTGPASMALQAKAVAKRVLDCATRLGYQIRDEEEDDLDKRWSAGDVFSTFTVEDVQTLLEGTAEVLASQPTLVEAAAPCKVFGDTHGQLRDLLLFFNIYGWPGNDENQFVFNGDYVDRGAHQVEVALIVCALKVSLPDKVWLLRGNHEEASCNRRYGFDKACAAFFGASGESMFGKFHDAFNMLPLACLIGGKILSLHGGVGEGHWTLDDLRRVQRPLTGDQINSSNLIYNILWSDPIEEDDPHEEDTSGLHLSPRSKKAVKFGWNVTVDFCKLNGLDMILRAHQFKKAGFGFDVMHDNMLIRVFTARDYEGMQENDGSILSITPEEGGLLRIRAQCLRSITRAD